MAEDPLDGDDGSENADAGGPTEEAPGPRDDSTLPTSVVREAERLTRLARDAVDESEATAYRDERERVLGEYDYTARVRDDEEEGETLVCHPAEWLDDAVVDVEAIESTARAVEVALDGRGDQGDWATAERVNRTLVETVQEKHGDVHAANASEFADFMGNHYAMPIPSATATQVEEFLEEYFPRNAWPSSEQEAAVERSLRYVFEATERPFPLD
ncbi:MAG: rnhA operon protein [Halanaeroarchaeum sp.]